MGVFFDTNWCNALENNQGRISLFWDQLSFIGLTPVTNKLKSFCRKKFANFSRRCNMSNITTIAPSPSFVCKSMINMLKKANNIYFEDAFQMWRHANFLDSFWFPGCSKNDVTLSYSHFLFICISQLIFFYVDLFPGFLARPFSSFIF